MNKLVRTLRQISLVPVVLLFAAPATLAALPIDVEVVTEPDVPITAPQQWAKLLGAMDLGRVRIRSSQAGDKPEIKQDGSRYKVVALLSSRGNLIVDGRRYRSSDRRKLRTFFESLASEDSFGQEKGVFGLTQKQFHHVFADLSRPIEFATAGQDRSLVLNKVVGTLAEPVEFESGVMKHLRRSKPIETELQGLSAGTGLAILLREIELILRPENPPGKAPQLVVEQKQPKIEGWPVGWKIDGSPRKAAPQMFEFLTIEIDGYTLDQALDALQPRLKIPLFLDHQILRKRNIKPADVEVKLLPEKTYLKKSMDRLLSQARLACELRVDERGNVFCWVTQFGKDSRRAE